MAERSPAPIVEQTENPTPAPEQEAAKRSSKSKRKTESDENKSAEPAKPREPSKSKERFAGTWSGKINQGIVGEVVFTLTFAAGGSQVTEHSSFGTYTHPATSNGRSTTWTTGLLNDITWTFTPNADGNTAQVTAKSSLPLGANGNSIFRRGGTPAVVKPPSEFPTAKPVPEKPGFVYNPFDPTSKRLLDVTGKPSGTKVKDPSTGKMFIVP
jgi:hypothetical protein